jgi:hypothetical protein
MKFPVGGHYVVPGALTTIEISIARDLGIYHQPNVWLQHDLNG